MKYGILFVIIFVGKGCRNNPDNLKSAIKDSNKIEIKNLIALSDLEGRALLKLHCFSCHNPASTSHDSMLAPPMVGIKFKYKELYSDRIEFIGKMAEFIENPSKENAVMKGPVRRFGLMPKSVLSKKEILEIVAFIYDSQLDVPDWFPEHFEEGHNKKWTQ